MTERELQLKNRLARLESGLDPVTPLGGDTGRLQFLAGCKGNIARMTMLRRLLRESGRRLDVYRLTDDQVVEEIAQLIWSGEIELGSGRSWNFGSAGKTVAGPPSSPPRAASPLNSAGRAPEPDSPTFPPGINGAAQAAALSAAAASAAPFCPH